MGHQVDRVKRIKRRVPRTGDLAGGRIRPGDPGAPAQNVMRTRHGLRPRLPERRPVAGVVEARRPPPERRPGVGHHHRVVPKLRRPAATGPNSDDGPADPPTRPRPRAPQPDVWGRGAPSRAPCAGGTARRAWVSSAWLTTPAAQTPARGVSGSVRHLPPDFGLALLTGVGFEGALCCTYPVVTRCAGGMPSKHSSTPAAFPARTMAPWPFERAVPGRAAPPPLGMKGRLKHQVSSVRPRVHGVVHRAVASGTGRKGKDHGDGGRRAPDPKSVPTPGCTSHCTEAATAGG